MILHPLSTNKHTTSTALASRCTHYSYILTAYRISRDRRFTAVSVVNGLIHSAMPETTNIIVSTNNTITIMKLKLATAVNPTENLSQKLAHKSKQSLELPLHIIKNESSKLLTETNIEELHKYTIILTNPSTFLIHVNTAELLTNIAVIIHT